MAEAVTTNSLRENDSKISQKYIIFEQKAIKFFIFLQKNNIVTMMYSNTYKYLWASSSHKVCMILYYPSFLLTARLQSDVMITALILGKSRDSSTVRDSKMYIFHSCCFNTTCKMFINHLQNLNFLPWKSRSYNTQL